MDGTVGIIAPADGAFLGSGPRACSPDYLPVENAPLRREVKRAVRSPQLHRPLFGFKLALVVQF